VGDKTQIGDADSLEVEGIPEGRFYSWTGSCFEIAGILEADQAPASSAASQWPQPMIRIGSLTDAGYNKNPQGVSPEYRKQCKKAYHELVLSKYRKQCRKQCKKAYNELVLSKLDSPADGCLVVGWDKRWRH
jgi:hypothetical protein